MKKIFLVLAAFVLLLSACGKQSQQQKRISSFSATAQIHCLTTDEVFSAELTQDSISFSSDRFAMPVICEKDRVRCGAVDLECRYEPDSPMNLPEIILGVINGDVPQNISVIKRDDRSMTLELPDFCVDIIFGETK